MPGGKEISQLLRVQEACKRGRNHPSWFLEDVTLIKAWFTGSEVNPVGIKTTVQQTNKSVSTQHNSSACISVTTKRIDILPSSPTPGALSLSSKSYTISPSPHLRDSCERPLCLSSQAPPKRWRGEKWNKGSRREPRQTQDEAAQSGVIVPRALQLLKIAPSWTPPPPVFLTHHTVVGSLKN